MKIAQVAPLMESVPPRYYGGIERIASYVTEALVAQGHDVTLFASGDSVTSAALVPCCSQALRLNGAVRDWIPYHMVMLDKVKRRAHEFDVIHFHVDVLHFPLFRDIAHRTLTTLHGRQDLPDHVPFYAEFPEMPLVSISNAQRAPMTNVSFAATVYNGIPSDLLRPVLRPRGGYLAFLGRISPEKGIEPAIRIARATGIPLKVAAKVDPVDVAYFKQIEPMLSDPLVEFVGEIDDRRKQEFLGEALGLLFPIDWPEPFGLVMIEAFACGTPVLGLRRASVPEIVDDGVTGLVVDSEAEACAKVPALLALDRSRVREGFDQRFAASRMARDYMSLYKAAAGEHKDGHALLRRAPARGGAARAL
jgi:glycosyltransferase involved in cell wall biosynthesis